jgi:2-methylaconitate cis-trans-isomerase PrpF
MPLRGDQWALRAVFMRGGTSRGAFLHDSDLPADPLLRDALILGLYGSPDIRQVDGIGGGDSLTSKVMIVGPASRPDADVDYTFGQVRVNEPIIDYKGNCGNMTAGIGVFAVDERLVPTTEGITRVRMHNTNTGKVVVAEVPVRDGVAMACGDTEIPGVPGTGAGIMLDWLDSGGSVTGRLLPTGNPRDELDTPSGRFVVSLVDASNPCVFVRAADLGIDGAIMPTEISARPELMAVLEQIRGAAAVRLGFVDDSARAAAVTPAIPKVAFVAPPKSYRTAAGREVDAAEVSLVARCMSMQTPHKAYAVTVGICTAAAAKVPGTVVAEVYREGDPVSEVRIGHPGGVLIADMVVEAMPQGLVLTRAAVARTARRIMEGTAYVPLSKLPADAAERARGEPVGAL